MLLSLVLLVHDWKAHCPKSMILETKFFFVQESKTQSAVRVFETTLGAPGKTAKNSGTVRAGVTLFFRLGISNQKVAFKTCTEMWMLWPGALVRETHESHQVPYGRLPGDSSCWWTVVCVRGDSARQACFTDLSSPEMDFLGSHI